MQKVICLSTAHVTSADINGCLASTGADQPVFSAEHEYGAFIYIPQSHRGVWELCRDAREFGYSESFAKLIRFGSANECRYIHLDCDGPTQDSDQLDIHDW